MILWLNESKNLSKKKINMYVFCAFQIYKIKTTPLAPCQDGRKFGWEVEHVKACATAAQEPYATYATSYLICPGLFVKLILFGQSVVGGGGGGILQKFAHLE